MFATKSPPARSAAAFNSPLATSSRPGRPPRPAAPAANVPVFTASFVLGGAAALFVMFSQSNNLLGKIGAIGGGVLALHGLWRGGLRKVAMLGGAIGLTYLAGAGNGWLQLLLSGTPVPAAVIPIAVVLVCIILYVAMHRLSKYARHKYVRPRKGLLALDRYLGATIGAAEGLFIVLCLAWPLSLMKPDPAKAAPPGQMLTPREQAKKLLVQMSGESRAGRFGEFVAATNPFERVPALKQMIDEFNQTGSFKLPTLDPNDPKSLNKLLEWLPADAQAQVKSAVGSAARNPRTPRRR